MRAANRPDTDRAAAGPDDSCAGLDGIAAATTRDSFACLDDVAADSTQDSIAYPDADEQTARDSSSGCEPHVLAVHFKRGGRAGSRHIGLQNTDDHDPRQLGRTAH
jgi:hypothetical protein